VVLADFSPEASVPTYVYRCEQCGAVIERRQAFQDPPLTTCESCSGQLRRVLQPVGVIFKGSGFYSTDYRNSARGARDDAKGETSKSDGEGTSSGSSSTSDNGSSTSSTSTSSAPATTPSTSTSDTKP
jgi:putative FmdB family regulatory protein